jgi:hypothetical protein
MEGAKKKAIEHVKNNPPSDVAAPASRGSGEHIPEEGLTTSQDRSNKRARKSGGFTAINLDPSAPQRAAKREMASAAMASAANTRMPTPPPPPQLQRSQAARGSLHGTKDSKVYGGIKYERKSSGPFQGRFADQGCIITIDGDDYVEYRVLTKPSFF